MKYIYKVYSGYDGFTPRRLPDRLLAGGLLRLGWRRYVDTVEVGDEVWVYFFGPGVPEPAVYARGRVRSVDLENTSALIRVFESSSEAPLSEAALSTEMAALVRARGVQVFLFPENLSVTSRCTVGGTADTCARKLCEGCPTWRGFYRIEPSTVRPPDRLVADIDVFAPGYWVSPPRGFLISHLGRPIRVTTELFGRFKSGIAPLAYPLALGAREALRARVAPSAVDALVPIPLSPEKAERGELHRSLAISNELSDLLGVPVRTVLGLRAPISKRAMGVSPAAFETAYRRLLTVDDSARDLGRILLVDDVSTRGSTAQTALQALLDVQPELRAGVVAAGQMVIRSAVVDDQPLRAAEH